MKLCTRFAFIALMFVSAIGVSVGTSAEVASAACSRSATHIGRGPVKIPARYVYNPKCSPVTLHDYCSNSPDYAFDADFRGPCARHDLCYMDHTAGKSTCDTRFKNNLYSQCDFFNSGASRYACRSAAYGYYQAVKRFGDY